MNVALVSSSSPIAVFLFVHRKLIFKMWISWLLFCATLSVIDNLYPFHRNVKPHQYKINTAAYVYHKKKNNPILVSRQT